MLTYYNHPKSMVYLRVLYWCYTLCGFGQMHNDMCPSLWYHTEYFHCPKNISALPVHIPALHCQWSLWRWICLHGFAFCRMSLLGIIQCVAFSNWLLSLNNMYFQVPPYLFVAWLPISFYCWTILGCLDVSQFILSPTEGHLIYFEVSADMKRTAVNTHV